MRKERKERKKRKMRGMPATAGFAAALVDGCAFSVAGSITSSALPYRLVAGVLPVYLFVLCGRSLRWPLLFVGWRCHFTAAFRGCSSGRFAITLRLVLRHYGSLPNRACGAAVRRAPWVDGQSSLSAVNNNTASIILCVCCCALWTVRIFGCLFALRAGMRTALCGTFSSLQAPATDNWCNYHRWRTTPDRSVGQVQT
jgi:hypothetical protein